MTDYFEGTLAEAEYVELDEASRRRAATLKQAPRANQSRCPHNELAGKGLPVTAVYCETCGKILTDAELEDRDAEEANRMTEELWS